MPHAVWNSVSTTHLYTAQQKRTPSDNASHHLAHKVFTSIYSMAKMPKPWAKPTRKLWYRKWGIQNLLNSLPFGKPKFIQPNLVRYPYHSWIDAMPKEWYRNLVPVVCFHRNQRCENHRGGCKGGCSLRDQGSLGGIKQACMKLFRFHYTLNKHKQIMYSS